MRTFLVLALALLASACDLHTREAHGHGAAVSYIAHRLEERLGIHFPSLPTLAFAELRGKFDLPNEGTYVPHLEAMYLHRKYGACDFSSMHPRAYVRHNAARPPCLYVRVRRTLAHELGHHLMEHIVRVHAPNGWLRSSAAVSEGARFAMRMVSEGVGEYFEYALNEYMPTPNEKLLTEPLSLRALPEDAEMTERRAEHLRRQLREYGGGYALVKPVLDEDAELGLRCLATHGFSVSIDSILAEERAYPLLRYDFSAALQYRMRMLKCIRNLRKLLT